GPTRPRSASHNALREPPTARPRNGPLGEEDPRQDALLRDVGRPRRRPGELPRTEGRSARRPQAPRGHRGHHRQGTGQSLPERQASLGERQRTVPPTWTGYKEACDEIVSAFGKGRLVADLDPEDFADLRTKLAKKGGPHRLGTVIQCVRCCFKFA